MDATSCLPPSLRVVRHCGLTVERMRWRRKQVRVDVAMPDGKTKAVAYEPTRGIGLCHLVCA